MYHFDLKPCTDSMPALLYFPLEAGLDSVSLVFSCDLRGGSGETRGFLNAFRFNEKHGGEEKARSLLHQKIRVLVCHSTSALCFGRLPEWHGNIYICKKCAPPPPPQLPSTFLPPPPPSCLSMMGLGTARSDEDHPTKIGPDGVLVLFFLSAAVSFGLIQPTL